MQIDIKTQGLDLTGILTAHVQRRLDFALSWARQAIKGVTVRLSDENGPKGGKDKRCSIFIHLPSMPDVVISDTDAHVQVAIDRAADRVGQVLSRRFRRQRDFRRGIRLGSPSAFTVTEATD
jgi:putative sigma-54 modulation protein